MDTGKVRRFLGGKKNFGWITRDSDGHDVFIPPPVARKVGTISDGDAVSFEAEPDPKDPTKLVAKNLTVTSRAQATPSPPSPPTPPAPPPPSLDLAVEIKVKGSAIIEVGKKKKKQEWLPLLVWVEVTRAGVPVMSKEVTLDIDGNPVVQFAEKVHTGKKGLAFFRALLPADKIDCVLVAHVGGNDYTAYWNKASEDAEAQEPQSLATTKAAPATPAPQPEPPKVAKAIQAFRLGSNEQGFTCFRVFTTVEDKPGAESAPGEFFIDTTGQLEDQDESGQVEALDPLDSYDSDDGGQAIVQVRPKTAGEVTIHFRLVKFPTKFAGPFKATRQAEATPAEAVPAGSFAAEPKVEKVGQDSRGIYTFRITGALNATVKTEGVASVELRKAPCPDDDATWTKHGLTVDADEQLVHLRVTEERARGMIRFCIGAFRSDSFYVTHHLPPQRPKPAATK